MDQDCQFSLFSNFLRIHFFQNQLARDDKPEVSFPFYSDYHYFWLRHNCDCRPGCRHETTNERMIDASQVPLDIQPISVQTRFVPSVDATNGDGGGEWHLDIEWKPIADIDGTMNHHSVYSWSWLYQHAYAVNRRPVPSIPSNNISMVEIDYGHWLVEYPHDTDSGKLSEEGHVLFRREVGKILKRCGLVVLRKRGLDTESIIRDLLPAGKDVIQTHFGRIEDLRTDNTTNTNNDQLGYTNAGVDLHTDQPFIQYPPGMQLLQCVTPADIGGENYIVDAKQVALWLRYNDPNSFNLLTQIPVTFHRKQANFESVERRPIIELDGNGDIVQLRYSYFTYAPHNVAFHLMEPYYQAYNTFAKLVRDVKNQYRFMLNSGDAVLYDNWRCFHARTSFSGPRHVRGVYFDSNDVAQHLFMNDI